MTEAYQGGVAGKNRRGFLASAFSWLGLGSLATALASTLYANFRFFFPKVLYEPPAQFSIGVVSDYPPGTVSDRWAKEHQVFVVREQDVLYALLRVCTHLGCLTNYFSAEGLFKCPCHGSIFSLQGDPLAGPAPVALYRLALSVGVNGQIVVDKNRREDRPGPRNQSPYVLKV